MREILELAVDEPTERLQQQGIAAVVYSEKEDWACGLDPAHALAMAKRLMELAAGHERQFGKAAKQ